MDVCPTDIILAPAERIWRLVTDPRVLRADQLVVDRATRQPRWHASQATRGRNDGRKILLNVDCSKISPALPRRWMRSWARARSGDPGCYSKRSACIGGIDAARL